MARLLILAPLRGVTIRCFRTAFAGPIRAAGFTEAVTPFIPAAAGYDPLKDRELGGGASAAVVPRPDLPVTPQFIGKDPAALRAALERIKAAGYERADLNCGCPFPMVRNKGRGAGLLRTPDVLRRLLEVGCATMGDGNFSVKARLGVERPDELLRLMPLFNAFPLRFLAVHARTARQMYAGACDRAAFDAIRTAANVPLVANGDLETTDAVAGTVGTMVGRAFIRALGERDDIGDLLDGYVAASAAELCGERPVLGRLKELLGYWKDSPRWRRRWQVAKMARSLAEIRVW